MKALACLTDSSTSIPGRHPFISTNPIIFLSSNLQAQKRQPKTKKLQVNPKGFASTQEEDASRRKITRKSTEEDPDEPIPQVVFERMMLRIVVSVGVPLATGIMLLKLIGYVKEQSIWDIPLWVPFLTTLVTFGASALGIAYGSLSTSLDPVKKGSVLGIAEARHNWVEMWKEENE